MGSMYTKLCVSSVEDIPPSLRSLRQWVLWRYETRDGKRTKCPYRLSGYRANPNDPSTWASAEEVLYRITYGAVVGYVGTNGKQYPKEPPGPADGIGIMFGKTVFGVDIDHARDPETGELSAECRDICKTLNSYTEISPSGEGVHILLLADTLPGRRRREGNVEMYGRGSARFFTFTGDRLPEYPNDLQYRQEELERVHARYIAKRDASPVARNRVRMAQDRTRAVLSVSDAEVLARAESGPKGEIFAALWRGDLSPVDGDHSRGDHALCRDFLYWSGGDLAQADRLFRQSGLYRPKWDERRGDQTYGDLTLRNALDSLSSVWTPYRGNGRKPKPLTQGEGETEAEAEGDAEREGEAEADLPAGTHLALAKRFVATYGEGLRYVPERGCWYVWDGRRWAKDVRCACVWGLLRAQGATLAQEGESAAQVACSLQGMIATERVARYDPAVLIHVDALDSDVWAINCENGTLDLRTGELRDHRPKDLITALVPSRYVPSATCPRWETFLAEAIPDPETRVFLQRLLGYGLTGLTSERVFSLCVGPTASGKSTLAAVLMGVLGPDYTAMLSSDALVHTRIEDLRIAGEFERGRIQIGSEVPREGAWRTSLLKTVTGGTDWVSCRPLYHETRQFKPHGLVILFANFYPEADAEDGAFWERCRVITFGETCPPDKRDPHLDSVLLTEREGILAWLVRGCLDWQADGLKPSPGVVEAGARYRLTENTIGRFLEESVIWDPSAEIPSRDLYTAFADWCESEGESLVSQKRFGSYLSASGFVQRRTRNTRIWQGLTLRTYINDNHSQ